MMGGTGKGGAVVAGGSGTSAGEEDAEAGEESRPGGGATAGIGGVAWRKSIRRRPKAELEAAHEQGQPRESRH
jgi:hypothetical protein